MCRLSWIWTAKVRVIGWASYCYSSANNVGAIISRNVKWSENVANMIEEKCMHLFFMLSSRAKRPSWGIKRRLEDHINLNVHKHESEVSDRLSLFPQWQAAVWPLPRVFAHCFMEDYEGMVLNEVQIGPSLGSLTWSDRLSSELVGPTIWQTSFTAEQCPSEHWVRHEYKRLPPPIPRHVHL
jgi:hypothetical protein